MPTTIKQIEEPEKKRTVLKVEGEMLIDDALQVERIALGL